MSLLKYLLMHCTGFQTILGCSIIGNKLRGVVQVARTLAWGARGRSFKSSHPELSF